MIFLLVGCLQKYNSGHFLFLFSANIQFLKVENYKQEMETLRIDLVDTNTEDENNQRDDSKPGILYDGTIVHNVHKAKKSENENEHFDVEGNVVKSELKIENRIHVTISNKEKIRFVFFYFFLARSQKRHTHCVFIEFEIDSYCL